MSYEIDLKPEEVGLYALGGLGEIGKNTYGIEYQDEIIVVDAGIKFPEDDLLGIDYVIPNYTYLVDNIDRVKALVITHGHEDHIGAISYFLKEVNVPVYAGPLAIALIKNKLEEKQMLNDVELHEITDGSILEFDKISVEFFRTTHSIPDVFGVAVHTPAGTVVESGDFKFDLTPTTGQKPNLYSMARLGHEGVLALMSDSTNAERNEWTKSEQWVEKSVYRLFEQIKHGRIIFATFASNMNRVKMAAEAAVANGRKIAVFGRSMESAVTNGRALGFLNVPDTAFVEQNDIKNIPDDELMILSTGSQGEAMAALARIAEGTHKHIQLKPKDNIIFSSNPIPGNTAAVNQVINKLEEGGANVIYGKLNNIHTSGHGGQEEEKMMIALMKPKYFVPVHGEYRMLKVHESLAHDLGMDQDHTFTLENGDVLALTENSARIAGHFPAEDTYIDGSGIGDIGSVVLHDRKKLSQDGLVVVTTTIDLKNKEILSGPDILSRGFIYMRESSDLINEGRHIIFNSLRKSMFTNNPTESSLRQAVIDDLSKFLYEKTERKPMILPMIIIVNN